MYPKLNFDPGVFNLTMTYRLDSDIPFPYSEILDKQTNVVVAPDFEVDWLSPDDTFTG